MYLDKLEHLKKLTSRSIIANALKHKYFDVKDFEDLLDYAEFRVKDIMVRRYNEKRYFESEHHAINYLYMFIKKSVFKHYYSLPSVKGRERNASAFSPKMMYAAEYSGQWRNRDDFYGDEVQDEKLELASFNSGYFNQQETPIEEMITGVGVLIDESTAPEYIKEISKKIVSGKSTKKMRSNVKAATEILIRTKIKQLTWIN